MSSLSTRRVGEVECVGSDYIDELSHLDPVFATHIGITDHDQRLPDYSPDGHEARAALARQVIAALADLPTGADPRTLRAAEVLAERAQATLGLHESGQSLSSLNVVDSPPQRIRLCFTEMPTKTVDDWVAIRQRLLAVPAALNGVRTSLVTAAARRQVSARRQVLAVADQCEWWSGANPYDLSIFEGLTGPAWTVPGVDVESVRIAAHTAARSFGDFAGFLRRDLAGRAPTQDAVGARVHQPMTRWFLGADIDPVTTYEQACDHFLQIAGEAGRLARRIVGTTNLRAAANALDRDSRYLVTDASAYLAWLEQRLERAGMQVAASVCDFGPEVAHIECIISDVYGAPAYYTGPSLDSNRPGRISWAVPISTPHPVWRDATRIHHEGFPGHHLQLATLATASSDLTRFQRSGATVAGYGEGWAVYAEALMDEIGALDDDGLRFGYFDALLLRAARVVLDLGLHLSLPVPVALGPSGVWTRDAAIQFLLERTATDAQQCAREVDRYLAWPAQALSYQLGGQAWAAARVRAEQSLGPAFDRREFHRTALALGPLPLEQLEDEVAATGDGSTS